MEVKRPQTVRRRQVEETRPHLLQSRMYSITIRLVRFGKVSGDAWVSGEEFNLLIDHLCQSYELLRTQEFCYLQMKDVVKDFQEKVDHLETDRDAFQKLVASMEKRFQALERGDGVFVTPAPSMVQLPTNSAEVTRAEQDQLLMEVGDAGTSGDQEVTTEASA